MERIKQSFKSINKSLTARLTSLFKSPKPEHPTSTQVNHHLAKEKQLLMQDLQLAKRQWYEARSRLDFLIDHEQIDQAIYTFEAAERHYNMLIKQAKSMGVDALDDNEEEV